MRSSIIRNLVPGIILSLLFSGCRQPVKTPAPVDHKILTIAFYNTENLFDTVDDPGKDDQEFLPDGKRQWSARRFEDKISGLARALQELGNNQLPGMIGLCEVENEKVVRDLVTHRYLSAGNYDIIHFDDRDTRGIDMALAYRPSVFRIISKKLVSVRNSHGGRMARGILYAEAEAANGEVFHVFVNHWPSRENDDGSREAARKDMAAALKQLAGELPGKNKNSNIIIMGDMNDEPADPSLSMVLGAVEPGQHGHAELVNLMYTGYEKGYGSYKFRGDWKMLDNIIVSSSLLDNSGYRVENDRGYVYSSRWMEYSNSKGETAPDRTYSGNKYTGGISDHFPVYFRLIR